MGVEDRKNVRDFLYQQITLDFWSNWYWEDVTQIVSWMKSQVHLIQSQVQDTKLLEIDFWCDGTKFYQCYYDTVNNKITDVLVMYKNTSYKITILDYKTIEKRDFNRWWEEEEGFTTHINIWESDYSWQLGNFLKTYWPKQNQNHADFLKLLSTFLYNFHNQSKYYSLAS